MQPCRATVEPQGVPGPVNTHWLSPSGSIGRSPANINNRNFPDRPAWISRVGSRPPFAARGIPERSRGVPALQLAVITGDPVIPRIFADISTSRLLLLTL